MKRLLWLLAAALFMACAVQSNPQPAEPAAEVPTEPPMEAVEFTVQEETPTPRPVLTVPPTEAPTPVPTVWTALWMTRCALLIIRREG